MVYDFDGPRDVEGNPVCELVSETLLQTKFHETQYPFGHGYIIAGALMDILPDDYTTIPSD